MKKNEKKTMKMRSGWVAGLVALAVIGGVYASWDYAKDVKATDGTLEQGLVLEAGREIDTAHGTLSVTGTMTIGLNDNGSHSAEIKMGGDDISITYTPIGEGHESGVRLTYKLEIVGTTINNLEGQPILTVDSTDKEVGGSTDVDLTSTITKETIKGLLTPNLTLETYAKYQEFQSAFNSNQAGENKMKLKLTVSERE